MKWFASVAIIGLFIVLAAAFLMIGPQVFLPWQR
jgi:hypothetical protein